MFARFRKFRTHSDNITSQSETEALTFSDEHQSYIGCSRCPKVMQSQYAVLHPNGDVTCFECSWDSMSMEASAK